MRRTAGDSEVFSSPSARSRGREPVATGRAVIPRPLQRHVAQRRREGLCPAITIHRLRTTPAGRCPAGVTPVGVQTVSHHPAPGCRARRPGPARSKRLEVDVVERPCADQPFDLDHRLRAERGRERPLFPASTGWLRSRRAAHNRSLTSVNSRVNWPEAPILGNLCPGVHERRVRDAPVAPPAVHRARQHPLGTVPGVALPCTVAGGLAALAVPRLQRARSKLANAVECREQRLALFHQTNRILLFGHEHTPIWQTIACQKNGSNPNHIDTPLHSPQI